jgi:TonB-dependent receptor
MRYLTALAIAMVFVFAISIPAKAQTNGATLEGTVTDASGAAVPAADVTVAGTDTETKRQAETDGNGHYEFNVLPAGTYIVSVSKKGFQTKVMNPVTIATSATRLDVKIEVGEYSQEVQVHGVLQGEAEAVQIQQNSPDVVNAISAQQIESLPNANIADATGRLPGVTLERDEGEGKYVQVRGTEPRLTNVTIEGIEVPSPEVAVRQVKLDVVPADLVQSIDLDKTLSADQEGDAIGGTVNMQLKSAADQPTLVINGIGGYTPILNGREIGQIDGTVGQRFGEQKRLGMLIGLTYDYNGRGIDDIEPAVDPGFVTPYYDSIDIREYRYQRKRWGLGGSTDYRLDNNGSDLYLHYLYSDFKDYGNKWVYTLNDGGSPQFSTSQRIPNYSIAMISGGGKHEFQSSWLAWDFSVSNGRTEGAAGNPGVNFGFNGSTICNYDAAATTNPYKPQFDPACTAPGSPVFDPTQYSMTEFDTSEGPTDEVNLEASATMGKRYRWGSHDGVLQFGVLLRNEHDYQNAIAGVWDPNGTYLMSQFLSGFTNPNYYGGSYQLGPVTDYNKLNNFFLQNPGDFTLDVSNTHLGSDPNNYNLTERVTAAYVMNTLQFGRFTLQTGFRLEATELEIQGFETQDDINGNWISTTATHNNQWYATPLPSVQLRYRLGDNSDIRAVYGRGLSRPNAYDMVPYVVLDESTNPFNVSLGNPSLQPEHANDYDLLFEHFFQPYGVIQGGFFYKQLSDPIYYTNTLPVSTGPYAGYSVSQIINGSDAHVGGIELAYMQNFNFLPGAWRGLGVDANYTYTFSQANGLPGRTDTPALQRQAPNSFNIGPGYNYGRINANVGMSYNGAMVYQYQYVSGSDPTGLGPKGPAGDIYLYPHFQLDAQVKVRARNGLWFLVQGENITNEVFGFYTGSPDYVTQREFYKPTISIGFRWEPLGER